MISATRDRNYGLSSRAPLRPISFPRHTAKAVLLFVGYVGLTSLVMAGLLWMACTDVVRSHLAPERILFWGATVLLVSWVVLPRPDRFEPPGPPIERDEEPELFEALEEVGLNAGQPLPAEVYVVNEARAAVSSRGGIMGVGSRRIMLLGLPLLHAVTVQELQAILAHELGHYHRGEVPLGPWIHKTRTAIGMAIQGLRPVPPPVVAWFGNAFLRLTFEPSRNQEIAADRLAARAAGAAAMISALRAVHAAAVAYQTYVQQELQPVLQRGFLPPVGEGFRRFLDAPGMNAYLGAVMQFETAQGQADPIDSHPSLSARIAALEELPQESTGSSRRASSMMADMAKWELLVMRSSAPGDSPVPLEPIEWNRVVDLVYMPLWRARVDSQGHLLRGHTIGTVPTTTAEFVRLGALLPPGRGDRPDSDRARLDRAGQLILAAIAVRLAALGWSIEALPGDETILRLNGCELRPYSELRAILDGRVPPSRWRARCSELGVAEVPLWGTSPASNTQPAEPATSFGIHCSA